MRRVSVFAALAASLLAVPTSTAEGGAPGDSRVACTLVGTSRSDVLRGTPGPDVICGRGGGDVIHGSGGNDVVVAGRGADSLAGGGGEDVLRAGPGVDDLIGGGGDDRLYGGDDENFCDYTSGEFQTGCVLDREDPEVVDAVAPARVDVTDSDAPIVIRLHLRDDTGVRSVDVEFAEEATDDRRWSIRNLRLVDGDVRDGWWQGTLTVPRYARPESWIFRALPEDRADRTGWFTSDTAVRIVDRDPDVEPPEVQVLSPSPDQQFDLDASGHLITLRARATDDKAGVGDLRLCLFMPSGTKHYPCPEPTLVSGTRLDGVWEAQVPVWQDTLPYGTWHVGTWLMERSDTGGWGYGYVTAADWPGEAATDLENHRVAYAGAGGPVQMVDGIPGEASRAIEGKFLIANAVDLSNGPVTVTAIVRVDDPDPEGTSSVTLGLHDRDGTEVVAPTSLQPAPDWGAEFWRGEITLSQDLADGAYYCRVWTTDPGHERNYVSPGSPLRDSPLQLTLSMWGLEVDSTP